MSSTNIYRIGGLARCKATFTSTASTNKDPTTVRLVVTTPSGTDTVYTTTQLTKQATGIYYKDVSVTAAGRWRYQFTGTGTVVASDGDYFVARPNFASTST